MNRLIEAVERRLLMATDAVVPIPIELPDNVRLENGVLTVEGTPGNDRILVDYPVGLFIERPALRVTVNGFTYNYYLTSGAPESPELTRIVIGGGAGNDVILVGRVGVGAEIHGGEGNDTIIGGDGPDTINGGEGDDRMKGRGGTDEFTSGGGTIDRFSQDDVPVERRVRLRKDGTLTIVGSPTADSVYISEFYGTSPADVDPTLRVRYNGELVSFDLDDVKRIVVEGRGGDDGVVTVLQPGEIVTSLPMTLLGGAGADYLAGGNGDDLIIGGAGDDVLVGHGGDDVLVGGIGNDRLRGQDGDDLLSGGPGDDDLTGGDGEDARVGNLLSTKPGRRVRVD